MYPCNTIIFEILWTELQVQFSAAFILLEWHLPAEPRGLLCVWLPSAGDRAAGGDGAELGVRF